MAAIGLIVIGCIGLYKYVYNKRKKKKIDTYDNREDKNQISENLMKIYLRDEKINKETG